jgi:iron complex transport system ATP-binding protein
MNVLRLDKIRSAPWGTSLLRDISFELNAGEILGIIGPNGAGKTSLLQTITGDLSTSGGELFFLGKKLPDWKARPRARVLAVLPQLSLLNFPYTVEEVIMLGRTPHSGGYRADKAILQQVMLATDTECLQQRIYTRLSGGEKQRVQLARVFAQIWRGEDTEPRLLLLDEPTAALDLAHQQLIMDSLRALTQTGCAIAMVAHDFNLLSAIADKITVLRDGSQVTFGAPEAVLSRDIFAKAFDVEVSITSHPDTGRPLVISL